MEPLTAVVQYALERPMTTVGDNVALKPRAGPGGFVEDLAFHPVARVRLLLDLELGVLPDVVQQITGVEFTRAASPLTLDTGRLSW